MRQLLPLLACACTADSFYTDPVPGLDQAQPGDILRIDHIRHTSSLTLSLKGSGKARGGARVYRVLYRTTGLQGEPDVASARLAIPDDLEDDAPILAHLHGTVGLADRCAPSRDKGFGFESSSNPFPAWAAGQGWLVVEPDYLGLGPEGPHPYVARTPTGQSVLDALRSVTRFTDAQRDIAVRGDRKIALVGHSQGGHAVFSALAEAERHAPELEIVSAVALAAPGAPQELLPRLLQEDRWGGFLAMAVSGLVWAHPELGAPEDWVTDERLLERLEEDCLLGLGDAIDDPPSELLAHALLQGELEERFGPALAHEDLGGLSTETSLLVAHGTRDELLPLELTERYVERMVEAGTDATWLPIEGGDHLFLPHKARDEVRAFLTDTLSP